MIYYFRMYKIKTVVYDKVVGLGKSAQPAFKSN